MSSVLVNCLLQVIYFVYLECPINAQDLVLLGWKKWGWSVLIWAFIIFDLMMFNICGEFFSIGSIVRESVGQFNSLACYSGIWWRKSNPKTSSRSCWRFRGKRSRSNLPALQDVLLWLLPMMMAFSWFITKVPYQQGRQVRQCQLGPKKVTKPWFLGMKASTLAGLDQVFNCVNCVVKCQLSALDVVQ